MFQSHKKEPDISHNQPRPQPTVARLTEAEPTEVRLTEVRLTVDVLTLHHMERRLTPQPQLMEVKLMEVRLTEDVLTLHHMVKRLTPQLQLTEVKLTEEEPTEVNNTVTRRQFDYYANLFEDHQTPKKKSNIDNFALLFLCLFDIFNKMH